MSEWTDEAVPSGGAAERSAPAARERAAPRRTFTESITIGSMDAKPDDAGDAVEESITIGARAGRAFSANAKRMLENIDKHGSVADPEPETTSPPAAAGATDAGAAPSAPPVDATPAAAAAAPAPAPAEPADDHRERADRLAAHNQRLLTEMEQLRGKVGKRDLTAREKALDEAERSYLDDSVSAVRRLIATAIGSDDPKSKEVDDELTGLYQDLTERELSVPLDPVRKTARESARTRRLFERDKRERDTPKPAQDDTEAKQDAEHVSLIGGRLTAGKAAEKYPLMMTLASDLDGMKPEELVLKLIHRGFKTGELDPRTPDDQLIDAISKKIETHYQALADKLGKARTPSSTAAPTTQATVATDSKAEPQGNGPRTITNASASVAPATPPAKKPEPTTAERPKYRNEAERRRALAAKHFPQ